MAYYQEALQELTTDIDRDPGGFRTWTRSIVASIQVRLGTHSYQNTKVPVCFQNFYGWEVLQPCLLPKTSNTDISLGP